MVLCQVYSVCYKTKIVYHFDPTCLQDKKCTEEIIETNFVFFIDKQGINFRRKFCESSKCQYVYYNMLFQNLSKTLYNINDYHLITDVHAKLGKKHLYLHFVESCCSGSQKYIETKKIYTEFPPSGYVMCQNQCCIKMLYQLKLEDLKIRLCKNT